MPKTFGEIKAAADDSSQLWLARAGVGFLAPLTATLPAALMTSPTQLVELTEAEGWWPVGIVGTGGYAFSNDVEKIEVEGWGYSVPVYSEITKAPQSIQVTPLQMLKRQLREVSLGVDLSDVVPTAIGEIVFDENAIPDPGEYKFVVISQSGTVAKPHIRGKGFTKIKLAEKGDETWNSDEDSVGQELTFDVLVGEEGFPVRHYEGGAGFDPVKYGYKAP